MGNGPSPVRPKWRAVAFVEVARRCCRDLCTTVVWVESMALEQPRRNKILYIIPGLGSGGTQRQLAELVDNLDRTRYEPVLCVIHSEQVVPRAIAPQDCRSVNLGKTFRKWDVGLVLYRLCRLIVREKPALIHSFLNQANAYSRVAALLTGHRCVITSARVRVRGFWRKLDRLLEKALWRLSRVIVVNAETTKTDLVDELKVAPERIRVVHNGVDTRRFRPGGNQVEARRALGVNREGLLLGMVARYSPQKGYDTLVNAVAGLRRRESLRPLRVLCVGETTVPKTETEVRELVRAHELGEVFDLRGPQQNIEVVYHAMDVLVLPSRYEGFPNVLLEAFACGKPVIASVAANPEGLVRSGVNGWVFPTDDAEALARCLEEVVTVPGQELDRMGQRGREMVLKSYSTERMVDRVQALYSFVLGC